MKTVNAVCDSCHGTGLYSGFGEAENVAVQCCTCGGTGCDAISYTPFEKRKGKHGIRKVFEKNIGYGIGLSSIGGLSYEEWSKGTSFLGKEQRDIACPHLHNQSFELKNGNCNDVQAGQYIRKCPHFKDKDKCWQEWDKRKGK